MNPSSSLPPADMPIDASNAEAAITVRAAIAAIERQFVTNASEWRDSVAWLRLLARVLEQPARTCRRCAAPF